MVKIRALYANQVVTRIHANQGHCYAKQVVIRTHATKGIVMQTKS